MIDSPTASLPGLLLCIELHVRLRRGCKPHFRLRQLQLSSGHLLTDLTPPLHHHHLLVSIPFSPFPSLPMTLKIMDSPPPNVGTPAIAHLCDVILETLRSFGHAAVDFTAFRGEVQTLRKFLDLIERIRLSNEPRTPFEEEHFSDVEILLERCRGTLQRLCEILAEMRVRYQRAAPQDALQQALRSLQNPETVALRGRIGFYIQSLQMSLQTVKL